jgi:hypothetical protein
MTDKQSVLTRGPRALRLSLLAAFTLLTLALAGGAHAHKPVPLSPPEIGANPVVGTPLGVAPGSYHCDPACTETTYEFFRCAPGSNSIGCVVVRPASTNPFYTPTEDDIGFSLAAMVRQWTYDCNIKMEDCRNSAYEVMTKATAPVKEDAPPVPVKISTSTLPNAIAGIRYSQTLTLSSGKPPFTWTLAGGALPPGFSLSSSGVISGAATLAGTYTFTVRATGARKQTDSKQLSLVVELQLSPAKLPVAVAGTPYTQAVTVVAGGTPPYTWEVTGGVLPAGLTLSKAGVFSGTPERAGPATVMVGITDARGARGSYIWTLVVSWVKLAITPDELPPATHGLPYRQQLTASGGKAPYRFLLVSENPLPDGLTLSGDGVLAGRPTAAAGTYTFTIVFADANDAPGSIDYTLTINPAAIRLASRSLSSARVGRPYKTTLKAKGGRRPYTFARAGGQLPAGLRMTSSGVITGEPHNAGTFRFMVRASDADRASDERWYRLVVSR